MLASSLATREADTCLAALLKQKNQDAFAQLYDRYAGALYGFICRNTTDLALADTQLQEVFIRAWQSIERYDPEHERLFTWMFRIATAVSGPAKQFKNPINL